MHTGRPAVTRCRNDSNSIGDSVIDGLSQRSNLGTARAESGDVESPARVDNSCVHFDRVVDGRYGIGEERAALGIDHAYRHDPAVTARSRDAFVLVDSAGNAILVMAAITPLTAVPWNTPRSGKPFRYLRVPHVTGLSRFAAALPGIRFACCAYRRFTSNPRKKNLPIGFTGKANSVMNGRSSPMLLMPP
jgi:hypothetical protein